MPDWFFALSMTIFGLLFGSFANVVIWRVPRGESIVSPGSHCPSCGAPIAWYDNVPVASWLVLHGRCRRCRAAIAIRYPTVELASGALFLVSALHFGTGPRAVIAAASFWFLLVLAAIDLDCLRLPNPLIGLLALLGVGAAVAGQLTHVLLVPLPALEGDMVASASLLWSLGGAVLGAGLAGGIAAVYGAIRHRKGLGMGDVKLLAAMGLLLGPYVILAIFLGSLIGMLAVLATTGTEWSSGRRIPFGPWLSLGAIITALAGAPLWQWYLQVASLA